MLDIDASADLQTETEEEIKIKNTIIIHKNMKSNLISY